MATNSQQGNRSTNTANGRTKASLKLGHVPILQMPLAALSPAKVNDLVYRPVDPAAPDVQELAESIRKKGVLEPLVITTDNVILSGHRRRVACLLARLTVVPCRRENVASTDPEFLPLLIEYNRQRVKTLDEVLREEVVAVDPEAAYQELLTFRKRAARVDVDTIEIEGYKRRARISKAKQPFLDAIQRVLDELRDFWPLTDRSIHYQLLNDPPLTHASKAHSIYRNTVPFYKQTCELLTRARLEGIIPWAAIHDPTRPVAEWEVYRSTAPFLREQLENFLNGYCRDLLQSQPNHIEIVGEKNTIESIIRPVAMEHCIPYTIGRGYSCIDARKKLANRYYRSGKEELVLLFLSDFDPEGEDIPHSFARSMRDDFGIREIVPVKVALTADQVEEMDLPPQMKAKETSSRAAKFTERHGNDVFELEAIPPDRLQGLLTEVIDGVLDVDAYNHEVEEEKKEAAYLAGVRRRLLELMSTVLPPPEDS
jgi:hypothetical protein